jgi:sensor domain CHASE-containing protein
VNIDLLQISYKVVLIILAFLAAVVVTKTVSKYFKLDEKVNREEEDKK